LCCFLDYQKKLNFIPTIIAVGLVFVLFLHFMGTVLSTPTNSSIALSKSKKKISKLHFFYNPTIWTGPLLLFIILGAMGVVLFSWLPNKIELHSYNFSRWPSFCFVFAFMGIVLSTPTNSSIALGKFKKKISKLYYFYNPTIWTGPLLLFVILGAKQHNTHST
jgi:hypothetical protein